MDFIDSSLQNSSAKILLFLILLPLLVGCNATKRVPENTHLLKDHTIYVDGEKEKSSRIYSFLLQQPNARLPLFGTPVRLHAYNWARPNIDSILRARLIEKEGKRKFLTSLLSRKQLDGYINFRKKFNSGLKKAGEPPALITDVITKKSANRLKDYYYNQGYFEVVTDYEIHRDSSKTATVDYNVDLGPAYHIDSLKTFIDSPIADSIYNAHRDDTYIKKGERYTNLNLGKERIRVTELFRNNGLFHLQPDLIQMNVDTSGVRKSATVELNITDRKITNGDSAVTTPYKIHKISKVNILTDYSYANRNRRLQDSIFDSDFNFFAYDKIRYRLKALTDVIPLKPGAIYSDLERTQTLNRLSGLRIFKYPDIQYTEDPEDSTGTDLVANINLTPLEKYKFRVDFDASTSNIQDIGFTGFGSILIRNIFRGAETLELSARGSIGASDDAANPNDNFFNITEIGADLRLTIPRIFFPINTSKLISPGWQPTTSVNLGFSTQQNIGLDRNNVSGRISYNWNPKSNTSFQFDLLDAQFVRNLNINNFFNIYTNSFEDLNAIAVNNLNTVNPDFLNPDSDTPELSIPNGAQAYIDSVLNGDISLTADEVQDINVIEERRERLIENNLIVSTNFGYTFNNRENIFDDTFSSLRLRLELAGNLLSLIANTTDATINEDDNRSLFGVVFSQYIKTEVDYIKNWALSNNNRIAVRAFGGLAIPYGNSENIPFTRSFFAGGSNDNRAWRAYELGPGSSGGPNEFNEANFKLAFNIENRFKILGIVEGALFADIGNIWNIFDNVEDEGAVFTGFDSLNDIAIGSGFGLRFDASFFIFRLDVGFKTYDPGLPVGDRWFQEFNFSNAVYNIGINYPF